MLYYIPTVLSLLAGVVAAPTAVQERDMTPTRSDQPVNPQGFYSKICLAKNTDYCIVGDRQNGVHLAPRNKASATWNVWTPGIGGRQEYNIALNRNLELLSVGTINDGAWAWINSEHFTWQWNGLQLQLLDTNFCLDLKDGHVNEGTRIQIWTCYNNENQRWIFMD